MNELRDRWVCGFVSDDVRLSALREIASKDVKLANEVLCQTIGGSDETIDLELRALLESWVDADTMLLAIPFLVKMSSTQADQTISKLATSSVGISAIMMCVDSFVVSGNLTQAKRCLTRFIKYVPASINSWELVLRNLKHFDDRDRKHLISKFYKKSTSLLPLVYVVHTIAEHYGVIKTSRVLELVATGLASESTLEPLLEWSWMYHQPTFDSVGEIYFRVPRPGYFRRLVLFKSGKLGSKRGFGFVFLKAMNLDGYLRDLANFAYQQFDGLPVGHEKIVLGQMVATFGSDQHTVKVVDELENIGTSSDHPDTVRADAADALLHISPRIGLKVLTHIRKVTGTGLHNDSQNVHHPIIEVATKRAVTKLMSVPLRISTTVAIDDVRKLAHESSRVDIVCLSRIEEALRRIETDGSVYDGGWTLDELFARVWEEIITSPHRKELERILLEELEETCSTGHVTRLVNVFTGFADIGIQVVWRDTVKSVIVSYVRELADGTDLASEIGTRTERTESARETVVNRAEKMYTTELGVVDADIRQVVDSVATQVFGF